MSYPPSSRSVLLVFYEVALWLPEVLGRLPLGEGAAVLDIGSSTLAFRQVVQPHIDAEVHRPMRDRGAEIVHMDAKADEGVDVVADMTREDFLPTMLSRQFDLVLCANLIEHVTDRSRTVTALRALVAPSGHLAVTVPHRYPFHADPIDTMFRPSPAELAKTLTAADFKVVDSADVPVVDPTKYVGRKAAVRRLVPPLRWAQSCVLLQRLA